MTMMEHDIEHIVVSKRQGDADFAQYIAPLLGSFNIVCLAVRNSDWVSYIFGGAEANEGMGLLGFGVDWANITSRPFYYPLSTQISNYVGWAVNYVLLPAIFATNVWKSKNFPFISQNLFCTYPLFRSYLCAHVCAGRRLDFD